MESFESLTNALEEWFEKPLCELPELLQERVRRQLLPPWDGMSPNQRREAAIQSDYHHDPATETERQYWWDFSCRKEALENQLKEWEKVASPTASDLAYKEANLKELRAELIRMNEQERQPQRPYIPGKKESNVTSSNYIAFPKALNAFADRLGATREDLAAWIFLGPDQSGIAAYTNANELDPPPRFFYGYHAGAEDYIAPLMACWFKKEDVANFQPNEHFITGEALIKRWAQHAGIQPTSFIHAKIAESRLMDMHPTFGVTVASSFGSGEFPPLETGLFAMSEVTAIEEMDGIIPSTKRPSGKESPDARQLRLQVRIAELKTKGVKNFIETVATEEGISVSRIKQIVNGKSKLTPPPAKTPVSPWAGLAASGRQTTQKKSNTR